MIWTAGYLRSVECKIDDINNIGSRGVSKPQARGREWWPLVRGSPLPHCTRHYQLWTQRTWRKSPLTLRSSLKPASAVFKGANVSPSLWSWIDISTFLLIRSFWTKPDGYRVITMQYLPLPWPSRWSHMECGGGGPIQWGNPSIIFCSIIIFYAEPSKCNMFFWEVFSAFILQLLLMEQLTVIIHQ